MVTAELYKTLDQLYTYFCWHDQKNFIVEINNNKTAGKIKTATLNLGWLIMKHPDYYADQTSEAALERVYRMYIAEFQFLTTKVI